MQLARRLVGSQLGGVGHAHLADQHPLATGPPGVLIDHGPPATPDAVYVWLVPRVGVVRVAGELVIDGEGMVGEARALVQPVRHLDAETVDPAVQPEPQHLFEVLGDGRVSPVEVGLLGGEAVEVPLSWRVVGLADPTPCRAAEDRAPVVGRKLAVRARPVSEVEATALIASGPCGQRRSEPGVLDRRVVRHHLDDHLDPEPVRVRHHPVEAGQVAVVGMDAQVVRDVVAVVVVGRGVERGQPDRVDTEAAQVGKAGADPAEVADTVTVGVLEAPDVDLVDHAAAPPPEPSARAGGRGRAHGQGDLGWWRRLCTTCRAAPWVGIRGDTEVPT